jgi:Peroxiredoxin
MKKLVYLLVLSLIVFSCTKTDLLQVAQDSEKKLNEISEQLQQGSEGGTITPELAEQLSAEYDDQFEKTKQAYADYFRENINTPEGYEQFSTSRWTRRLTPEQLESVLNKADESFKSTEVYKKQSRRLNGMKTSSPGFDYKEIVSKDMEGNLVKLSSYVGNGKYILLDFWASWCPPCRREAPNLVNLYNLYKDKGLEIIGYSLDDDKDAWLKGVADWGLTWPQLSDLEEWESIPVIDYAVQGIPCTFLIDPDGKIVERNLTGEDLDKKLQSLFD